MASIFGFTFGRRPKPQLQTIAPPTTDDGSVDVTAGLAYGTYVDLNGTIKNESELITRYRQMAQNPEVSWAVGQIVDDAIVQDDKEPVVDIMTDTIDEEGLDPKIVEAIEGEFKETQRLLDFENMSHDIFYKWYVDGRINYHVLVDQNNPQLGIQELRYIDPRKIRKVRELTPVPQIPTQSDGSTDQVAAISGQRVNPNALIPGAEITMDVAQEYFVYNPQGFVANQYMTGYAYQSPTAGIKISKDAMIQVTSGLLDITGQVVISNLHKAIKPLNMFAGLEDAAIIYRLARAPERRIFYIDVGGLPRAKAEQYIREMRTAYKNRLNYDQATGTIADDRKFATMLEDFWFPRRGDNKSTEISVLPPGQSQDILEELEFFRQKLMQALNIPYGRTHPEDQFPLGGSSASAQITRDEVTFSKFIAKLRVRFAQLFLEVLGRQLVLKGILDADSWDAIAPKIKFRWARDNFYAEIQEREALNEKLNTLNMIVPYIGKLFSWQWVQKKILAMDDEDIKQIRFEISQEMMDPILNPMPLPGEEPDGGGGPSGGGFGGSQK